MAERIESLLLAWCENPFATDARSRKQAAARIAELDIATELSTLIGNGRLEITKQLVLAVAHARAASGTPESELLASHELPRAVANALPRRIADYTRVAAAAGRAYTALGSIVGDAPAMNNLRRDVWAACFGASLRRALELQSVIRDHDVLILGETGTGKEGIARAIQAATPSMTVNTPAPHSAINAAALPDTLVESELFGHAKGAFTGATEMRAGRLRGASGGTFFLDEVGDLPRTTQVKLLRVIETNEVYPLGADVAYHVDVRYVAATHKNLEELVARGEFRQDLFERLAGNIIRLPPLRERREDVFAIADAFIESYVPGGSSKILGDAAHAWLRSPPARRYHWPGNVRELQNVLRDLMLGIDPTLKSTEDNAKAPRTAPLPNQIASCSATLAEVNGWYIERVLGMAEGNLSAAARTLGVDRGTLQRRRLRP